MCDYIINFHVAKQSNQIGPPKIEGNTFKTLQCFKIVFCGM